MTFADQSAAVANPEPQCAGCPRELEFIECPRGCGLKYLAPGQKLTAAQFWRYGPWRMSVHLVGRRPGSRCPKPLFDGPVSFQMPTADDDTAAGTTTNTEEKHDGMGPKSSRDRSGRARRRRGPRAH